MISSYSFGFCRFLKFCWKLIIIVPNYFVLFQKIFFGSSVILLYYHFTHLDSSVSTLVPIIEIL